MLLFFLNSLFNVNPTDKENIKQLDKLDTITKFKFFLDVSIHVYTGSLHYTQWSVPNSSCIIVPIFRNSATTTIEQELKFVGTESGKLLAVRDIIAKVNQIVE